MPDNTSRKSAKVAKKATAKRVAAKKVTTKVAAKKSAAKKPAAKKSAAKKSAAKRPAAKKPAAKKAAAKKTRPRKAVAKATASGRKGSAGRAKSGAVLLAGGNPQIAKGDGDAPVQAYIAAMPGWKRDVGRRLDALVARTVPGVRKAIKWNSPFYGIEGQGWFLSFHCFTKYVKVTFFHGASLRPVPPGESKHKDVRYLDIHESDMLEDGLRDEARLARWVKQASRQPGWGKV